MKEKLLFLFFMALYSTYTIKVQKAVPNGGFETQNSIYNNAYTNLAAITKTHLGYQLVKTRTL